MIETLQTRRIAHPRTSIARVCACQDVATHARAKMIVASDASPRGRSARAAAYASVMSRLVDAPAMAAAGGPAAWLLAEHKRCGGAALCPRIEGNLGSILF